MSILSRSSRLLVLPLASGFLLGCAHLTQDLAQEPLSALEEEGPLLEVEAPPPSVHVVASGETVWSIARRYDLTVRELVMLNGIRDVRQLPVGSELVVAALPAEVEVETEPARPDVAAAPRSTPSLLPTATFEASRIHEVERGETLWRIARRYEVPIAELAAENDLEDPERLVVGRLLRVPGASRLPEPEPASSSCACEAAPPPAKPETLACEPPSPVPAPPEAISDASPYTAIDAILGQGDDYLDGARFEEAIDMADLGLVLLGDLWVRDDSGPRIARAELLRGIAHIALDRPSDGHASFRAALRAEPEIVLGPDASPKITRIFDSARTEVLASVR